MTFIVDDKTFDTAEKLLDYWQIEFKKNHPVAYWIDHSLFKNTSSVVGFAPHHGLKPWIFFPEIWYRVKLAWQRVFRKWDDESVWSFNTYMARQISQIIPELKRTSHAVGNVFEPEDYDEDGNLVEGAFDKGVEKWHEILDKIAQGFKAYIELDEYCDYKSKEYNEKKKQFNEAFTLLKKYFDSLWD